ncbi:MAG: hypothetical protein IKN57_08255, partial [Parasporobacterium sp.]|nr:hypothetical protein [Parasporobacterium sp.]
MLSEKLDQLIRISGATNGEIAYLSGFDRTNISHFRSGKRVPKREGAAFRSLVFGILLYYDQNGKNAELRKLIGAEEDAGPEEMRMLLSAWLFEGMSEGEDNIYSGRKSAGSAKRTRTVQAPSFFPERLHLSLGIAELSNVRFSHQLHTDPSLISRWNKGIRSPQNNPQLCERISTILLEQIRKLGRTEILAELMEISEPEVCQETFAAWLFQTKDPEDQNLRYAEDLLAAFENVAGKKILEAEEEENMSQILLPEKETPVYIGTDGLRTAVLRFLKEAIRTQTKELFLYSDERQDWLMKDSEFKNKWALLMRECVRNGTKICIIHNIDRDLEEMNQAIASWLPLYLSGRIESWYMKKKDQSRFSHTIFLNPENSVIASFHVKG